MPWLLLLLAGGLGLYLYKREESPGSSLALFSNTSPTAGEPAVPAPFTNPHAVFVTAKLTSPLAALTFPEHNPSQFRVGDVVQVYLDPSLPSQMTYFQIPSMDAPTAYERFVAQAVDFHYVRAS